MSMAFPGARPSARAFVPTRASSSDAPCVWLAMRNDAVPPVRRRARQRSATVAALADGDRSVHAEIVDRDRLRLEHERAPRHVPSPSMTATADNSPRMRWSVEERKIAYRHSQLEDSCVARGVHDLTVEPLVQPALVVTVSLQDSTSIQ